MTNDKTPKYLVVKNDLKKLALEKEEGFQLPAISKLMECYGVSLTPVVRAIRELVAEGYLNSRKGSGTFVSKLRKLNGKHKSNNIGLIFTDRVEITHPFLSQLIRSASRAVDRHNYNLVLVPEKEERLFGNNNAMFTSNLLDGYFAGLLVSSAVKIEEIYRLFEFDVPFVVIGGDYQDPRIISVTNDCFDNVNQLIEYCFKQGRKNIMYLSGPKDSYGNFMELNAYKLCMERHGLEFRENNFVNCEWNADNAYEAVKKRFADKASRPDAVVANGSLLSYGTWHALKDIKASVPSSVLLVQLGEIFVDPALKKSIPYLHASINDRSEKSASLLIDLIDGKEILGNKLFVKSFMVEPSQSQKKTSVLI